MTAIVKGHGADTDGEDIFIPDGVQVRMYTAEMVNLNTDTSLFALLDNAGQPGEITTGSIKNYTLYTQDDQYIAQWYALGGQSSVPIWWVGTDIPNQTRLCEDPNRLGGDPEAVTCRSQGVHTCRGVLGLVQEPDIVIVACRGSWVMQGPAAQLPATSYDQKSADTGAKVSALMQRINSGDAAELAKVEQEIDAMPQDELAPMVTYISYGNWQRARWLKEYANQNDLTQLFGQLESNKSNKQSFDGMLQFLDSIPSYGAALDNVATGYPDTFVQWFNNASQDVRNALARRPAIKGVVDQGTGTAPQRVDPAAIRARNIAALEAITGDTKSGPARTTTVMSGEGLVLLGEGHDFAAVRALGASGASGTVTFTYNRMSPNELNIGGSVQRQPVTDELRALLADSSMTYDYRDRTRVVIS
jgi:hypothetical protein